MIPVQAALPLDTINDGIVVTYRLVFPFLPPSKNVVEGWPLEWRSGAKRKWTRAVEARVVEQGIPVGNPKIGLAARLVFPTVNRRDPQNYAHTLWHWVPDGLVDAGVIDDDRDGRIEFGSNLGISFAVDLRAGVPKAKRQRTLISLTVYGAKQVER